MLARVTNYGYRKIFPTCLGNLLIPPRKPIEIDNEKAAKELSEFKDVEVKILEGESQIDYSKYKINELRNIAAQIGIKGTFSMKKVDLIKKLEEK